MIVGLRGILLAIEDKTVTVDVSGVWYGVRVGARTISTLGPIGDGVILHIAHIAETATLYGFAGPDERDLFTTLISVAGIGPNTALAILNTFTPDQLWRAVATSDTAALATVAGVGKRTAAKLIFDLTPKLTPSVPISDTGLMTVRDALVTLGYNDREIIGVLGQVPTDGTAVEQIRAALQIIGGTA